MTESNRANTGDTPTVLSLLLHESRERRDRQNAKLHAMRQLSRGAPIVLLTAGAIAVAASATLGPATLRLILLVAIALLAAAGVVEFTAICRWRDGPKVGDLLSDFHRPGRPERTVVALQLALISGAEDDYEHNEGLLSWARFALVWQAAAIFAALVALFLGFGELAL